MYEVRQIIQRLRLGESDRGIARTQRVGRRAAPATPGATVMLDFAVGEMAQVDFGSGPLITDRQSGEAFKTWFFVMTMAWSRHQYAEVVRDQSVPSGDMAVWHPYNEGIRAIVEPICRGCGYWQAEFNNWVIKQPSVAHVRSDLATRGRLLRVNLP